MFSKEKVPHSSSHEGCDSSGANAVCLSEEGEAVDEAGDKSRERAKQHECDNKGDTVDNNPSHSMAT